MIDPHEFVGWLEESNVRFFTGVPDSLLSGLGAFLSTNLPVDRHIIAANEGTAVATAIGSFLSTGRVPVVYLQNSGTGNAINPLLSLADPAVMGIPMLLVIGWRGEPGTKDEPQHVKQGRVMTSMLDGMEIPWRMLPKTAREARQVCHHAVALAISDRCPQVLLVQSDTFTKPTIEMEAGDQSLPTREKALIAVVSQISEGTAIISTTGMLSRELFEYRKQTDSVGSRDVLTVGGMGHASSIALGVALEGSREDVWCLDGDGAFIMHLGAVAVIGNSAPDNFFHVVFNNGAHDSVGGQPTAALSIDVPQVARALGYSWAAQASNLDDIPHKVREMQENGGPALLEIRVCRGARSDLGRPTGTPAENAWAFMGSYREQ